MSEAPLLLVLRLDVSQLLIAPLAHLPVTRLERFAFVFCCPVCCRVAFCTILEQD